MLGALAAIWGSSFMFITIALRDLAPSTLILFRMGFGALALAVFVRLAGHGLAQLRPYAWPLALLALINTAVPFFLIAWGQQYIDSGLAAIFNASAPLFTALFALAIDRSQRVTGSRLAGVVLAFGGVVLLVGFELGGGERAVAGGAGRRRRVRLLRHRRPLCGHGASPACRPRSSRSGRSPGRRSSSCRSAPRRRRRSAGRRSLSVLYLGVAATGVAYLLYFGLIAGAGASKAVLVTYLVPSLALIYGAVFLDESITLVSLVGLALVLAGVALGTGTVGRSRRARRARAASLTR